MFVNELDLEWESLDTKIRISSKYTIIIVDWDDTLLPTSWLSQNKISLESYLIPEKIKEVLRRVDNAVVNFLRKVSVLLGRVLIITNAQPQWIELSSEKFLPETHQFLFNNTSDDIDNLSLCSFSSSSSGFHNRSNNNLQNGNNFAHTDDKPFEVLHIECDKKIQLFSAREMFEKDYPTDPSQWKVNAFNEILRKRINQKFFELYPQRPPRKSFSDSQLTLTEEKNEQRGIKRSFSCLSLSTLGLGSLIEVEGESYEIETEFKDNDSFFSIDFGAKDLELEWPNENKQLKSASFDLKASQKMFSNNLTDVCNLISIGDCKHDCESLRQLNIGLDKKTTLLKTVKFIDLPTIEELLSQLEGLQLRIDKIVNLNKDLDLIVQKKDLSVSNKLF